MYSLPCVIFAGGKSSRMGEDKALLPFDNFPTLTQYQLQKLKKLFSHVYISCRDSKKFDFNADFIEDIPKEDIYAPTIGFLSIFEYLDTDSVFVISVDTPFISNNEIQKIIQKDSINNDATIAKTEFGIQPLCGIYHRSLVSTFKQMLNESNHKLGYLLKQSNSTFVDFSDSKPFLNLNTKEEYNKALKLI